MANYACAIADQFIYAIYPVCMRGSGSSGSMAVNSLGPGPFPRLRNKYRKWGVGKNEGKGLAHRVGLARARAGILARLERNVISCNCTAVSLTFPFRKGDACNATGILSLREANHIAILRSRLCVVTVG